MRNASKSWTNTFQANYIEQLTSKTGVYKEFATFADLLATAITHPGTWFMNQIFLIFFFKVENFLTFISGVLEQLQRRAIAYSNQRKHA